MIAAVAVTLISLAALLVPGPPAAAQDLDVDVDLLPLVQVPVAVARVEAAGVPIADLRMLLPTLFDAEVEPSEILNTLRVLPTIRERDIRFGEDDDDFGREARGSSGMGDYVRFLHERGLRGRELADAIHRELVRRGVPAGAGAGAAGRADGRLDPERDRGRRGVLERGFLVGIEDDDFVRGRGVAPGARRNPGDRGNRGKGPPDAARGERGGQGERGRGGPPEARGKAGGNEGRGNAAGQGKAAGQGDAKGKAGNQGGRGNGGGGGAR